MTAEETISRFNERFASIETMKGQVSVSYQSGEIYSGIFMYSNPGKIYIQFTNPPGKFIVTNGKKLWAYDSSTDVCGVQEMDVEDEEDKQGNKTQNKDIKPKLKGGIERFIRNYEARLAEPENPESKIIELVNEKWKYSDIKLFLDQEFLPVKAIFMDKDGDGFIIKLSDIKIGENIVPGIFNFNVPANAQVVKNPLDIR